MLENLGKCKHKLKEHRKVGENKTVMKCERCGIFAIFDYKELTIKLIEVQE